MQPSCEGSCYGGRSTTSPPTPGYSPITSNNTTAAIAIPGRDPADAGHMSKDMSRGGTAGVAMVDEARDL